MNNVRVRFAPSPTGPLHIGGVEPPFLTTYLLKNTTELLFYELKIQIKLVTLQMLNNI